MNHIIIILSCLLLLDCHLSVGNHLSDSAQISLRLDEEDGKEVLITVFEKYFPYAESHNAGQYRKKINQGAVKFNLALPSELSYVKIELVPTTSMNYFPPKANIFIIEPDDDVTMFIQSGNLRASGNGSAKINCQLWLYRMENYRSPELTSRGAKRADPSDVIDEYLTQMGRFHARQLSVIGDFKKTISSIVIKRMMEDCEGQTKLKELNFYRSNIKNPFKAGDWIPAVEKRLNEQNSEYYTFKNSQTSSRTIVNALYDYELLKLQIKKYKMRKKSSYSEDFPRFVKHILTEYDGIMRDQLLFFSFSNYRANSSQLVPLIVKSLKYVRDNALRIGLTSMLDKVRSGAPIKPFKFWDTDGNLFTLADFENKVVVLDFWFNGCGGCIDMHNELKAVQEAVRNKQDIIFVTVNVDYTKERWLSGIKSGLYTNDSMINLHIGPDGMKNEWLMHYGFVGYPHIIVIGKKGQIIAIDPPRPERGKPRDSFIELISSSL